MRGVSPENTAGYWKRRTEVTPLQSWHLPRSSKVLMAVLLRPCIQRGLPSHAAWLCVKDGRDLWVLGGMMVGARVSCEPVFGPPNV